MSGELWTMWLGRTMLSHGFSCHCSHMYQPELSLLKSIWFLIRALSPHGDTCWTTNWMNSMTPLKHLVPLCFIFSFFSTLLWSLFFSFLLPCMSGSQVNLSKTDSAFCWCRDLHSLAIVTRQHNCVSLVNEKLIPDRWRQRQQTTIRAFFIAIEITQQGFSNIQNIDLVLTCVCGSQVFMLIRKKVLHLIAKFYGMGETCVYSQFQESMIVEQSLIPTCTFLFKQW